MSPIPGPLILLAPPLLAAGLTYLVRRWSLLAALIASLTMAVVAALCLRLPLDQSAFVLGQEVAFGRPVVVLGQTLVLDPAGKMWLTFVFALPAVFYLFAWRISQGRSFFSFSLVILALYALVALLNSFALSVLVLAISATLVVFIVQAGQLSSTRGAQRYLVITLLAVPLLLMASWLVDHAALSLSGAQTLATGSSQTGGALSQTMAHRALLPAALGFGLLLATFPFGTWMPALAAEAPPMVSAFVFTVGQAMAFFLTISFLNANPGLLAESITPTVIQLAGLGMAASGGVMAAVQRDFGRLLGYAALSDLGILILAFNIGGSQGLDLALLHGVSRSAAITLMAAGLALVRHRAGTSEFARLQGVARRLPVATAGLMLGGLALGGFPFTAGFPTHWAVSRAVWNWAQAYAPGAQESVSGLATGWQEWVWAFTLVAIAASSIGIIVGLLRGLSAMSGQARDNVARQPLLASFMILVLGALTIVLGLYPQLLLEPISRAAQAFPLF